MNISKLNKSTLLLVALTFAGSQAHAGWFQSGRDMVQSAYAYTVKNAKYGAGLSFIAALCYGLYKKPGLITSAKNATLHFVRNNPVILGLGIGIITFGPKIAYEYWKAAKKNNQAEKDSEFEGENINSEEDFISDDEIEIAIEEDPDAQDYDEEAAQEERYKQELRLACIEAVINDIGFDSYGQLWTANLIEDLDIAKYQYSNDAEILQICNKMAISLSQYRSCHKEMKIAAKDELLALKEQLINKLNELKASSGQ